MIVTTTGIVVFPSDPVYTASRMCTNEWIYLQPVMDHQLVRNIHDIPTSYVFIKSRNSNADYFEIKEQLTNDLRSEIEASPP